MKFTDIEKFPQSYYRTEVELKYLKEHLERWNERSLELPNHYLVMNPEWQRGHVWNQKQKISFMEYFLKGGRTGRDVYFNCSTWSSDYTTPIYCLDGLQRLSTALEFLDNKVPVWGYYLRDFEDSIRLSGANFSFNMLQIANKRDLLKVYVDFNSGGTPHNPKEIKRVIELIDQTDLNEKI